MLNHKDIAFLVTALFLLVVFFMIGSNEIVLGAIVIASVAYVVKMKQRDVVMGEY